MSISEYLNNPAIGFCPLCKGARYFAHRYAVVSDWHKKTGTSHRNVEKNSPMTKNEFRQRKGAIIIHYLQTIAVHSLLQWS